MARQGENQHPPSYTTQVVVEYENKSLKRETRPWPDTANSSAIPASKMRVSKESRKTGKK